MKKILVCSLAAATAVMASGYRIPESSLNATALSAANVAHAHGADAAYYNPANMIWGTDGAALEVALTYIGLDKINYQGVVAPDPTQRDIDSKSEHFFVPTLHYVSEKMNNARVGLSIVTPAGLSKRWKDAPASYSAEEFTLETVEVNPSVAVAVNDKTAVAFGLRVVYSSGIVKSTSPLGSRDMEGDSLDYGYNLALSYKPVDALELAVTYRSQINLNIEGNAKLYSDGGTTKIYDGQANVTVPIPALLSLAAAYTFDTDTTVEFVYDRARWKAYRSLDFDYPDNPFMEFTPFGQPVAKNWESADAFRLGLTQQYDKWTMMAGALYTTTPVPQKSLGFELPDSDSYGFSLGGRYAMSDTLTVGMAGLLAIWDDRKVDGAVNSNGIDGEFSDAKVYMLTVGAEFKF